MPRGGARPGSGPKPRARVRLGSFTDPRDFPVACMNSDQVNVSLRLKAAMRLEEMAWRDRHSEPIDLP